MQSPQTIRVTVVVNGALIEMDANLNAPLHTLVQHALNDSGNSGRPREDWELKDVGGNALPLDHRVGEAGIGSGSTLYLTLRVGVQG